MIKLSKSKIFTDAEYKSLNERLNGSKKDKTGIFSSRVKPKIKEMIDDWFPQKKQLQRIIESKNKIKMKMIYRSFFAI